MTPPEVTPPLPVYSMLCSSDVERALLCFDTLYRRCRDRFRLTILDDGSITPAERERLLGRFPEMTILSPRERDDLVVPRLRGKPNCLRYRKEHVFSLKLLDGPVLNPGAFALCDGDIYFARDFRGLDRREAAGEDLVFMRDWCSAYSVSFTRRVWGPHRLRLPERFNAGILYVGPRTYDLDFIEWFLGQDAYRGVGDSNATFLVEQTTWAAMGGRVRAFHFDPAQVVFPTKERAFSPRLVAMHFTRNLRRLLDDPEFRAAVEAMPKDPPEGAAWIDARPAVVDGAVRGVARRIYRKLVSGPEVPPWASLVLD